MGVSGAKVFVKSWQVRISKTYTQDIVNNHVCKFPLRKRNPLRRLTLTFRFSPLPLRERENGNPQKT